MGVGSDTSISYDINIDLGAPVNDKFPKNLIFYYDSNYTNAIYKENNKINLKGFLDYESSMQDTINIYWKWPYETGITEQEKNDNNTADSFWIGKPISISASVTGKQEGENPLSGDYQVTFDANGGVFPEYGYEENATKSVTFGEAYGFLPVPSREGYTFRGWNGKNLINVDDAVNDCLIDNGDGTYTMWYNDWGRVSKVFKTNIPINTPISMSYDLVEYNGTYSEPLQIWGRKNYTGNVYFKRKYVITTPIDIDMLMIYQEGTQPVGTYTTFKNLQLEVGNSATAYEPYYVLSSTPVTQNKNHTLTAIWEKN